MTAVHRMLKYRFCPVTMLFLLAACQSSPARPTPASSAMYAAHEGGQITVQDDALRIGVGNLARETYLDERGHSVQGMRAGLWFYFRDHPESDTHVRAYEGQVLTIQGYTIRVVEINPDDRMVVLEVNSSPRTNAWLSGLHGNFFLASFR